MYLIDSDVLIDFLKNRKETVVFLNEINKSGISTSIICVGEILEGLDKNKSKKFLKFIDLINLFNINILEIIKFSKIRKELRKQGNLIDNFYILIAATCLVNDLTLVTNNLKHFKRIEGLKILDIKKPSKLEGFD